MATLKDIVRTVAPGLATLLGGPLAGGVVTLLSEKLLGGGDIPKEEAEARLASMLSNGVSPEVRAKILEVEAAVKTEMIRAGVREKEIAAEVERAYIADVSSARSSHSSNVGVFWLGLAINVASYALVAAVLFGSFALLTGSVAPDIDPTLAMAVGSIVGAVVQWVMANAAQANGFFFGSSPGSRAKDEALKGAIEKVASTLRRG